VSAAGRALRAAWAYDELRHRRLNAEGRDYWHVYTAEILDRLGLSADAVAPQVLVSAAELERHSLVILGQVPDEGWPASAASDLEAWVSDGGILIGFATDGLDELFGVQASDVVEQPSGIYSIGGYLRLLNVPLTAGIHPEAHADQPLIIVSRVRAVTPASAEAVADFLAPDPARPGSGTAARPTAHAAVTQRAVGPGWAFYIGFDLPQTMWLIHQGRPIDADYDGDGYLRVMDARIIGENHPEVAYTDELHLLLQSMIGCQPIPLVHQIPPVGGEVADVLLYFGGDDEGDPNNQIVASDFMSERGLPYHINVMAVDGGFALGPSEIEHIESNGHELALHYNFIDGFAHPTGFTQDDVRQQAAVFRAVFGRPSVCSVNHWCRWTGWCEPARWMMQEGQLADNSWLGPDADVLNPTNIIDFSFGSAFPRRRWDDWRSGNECLRFVQEPIVAYEVGYQGEETDFATLHRAVDMALGYHATWSLFHHPVYIAQYPACRRAIDELLRYLEEKGVTACTMGNDELARWWLARGEARVCNVGVHDREVSFEAQCDYPGGFVVKLCLGDVGECECTVSGVSAYSKVIAEFGRHWAYIPLPPGRSEVRVTSPSAASSATAIASVMASSRDSEEPALQAR